MQTFPDELLRMVFAEAAADLRAQATWDPDEQWADVAPVAPFRLASVSRRWRDVALDTTALWSLVSFRMDDVGNATTILRWLKLVIERGKQCPIDISSTWREFNWPADGSKGDVSSLIWALQAAASRWRRVFIMAPNIINDTFISQLRFPTPLLEGLSFTHANELHSVEQFESCLPHCPMLKKLRIHNGHILPSRDITSFPPLEYLSLVCDLPSLAIWQILALTPNLVRFELTLTKSEQNIYQPGSPISLRSLQYLACRYHADILFDAWIDLLRLPRLSSLELIHAYPGLLADRLPRFKDTLTTLKYASDSPLGDRAASNMAALPKLQTLVLAAPCNASFFESFSTHASLPALETLTLSDAYASEPELDGGGFPFVHALLTFVEGRNNSAASGATPGLARLKSVVFYESRRVPDWINKQLSFLTSGSTGI